MASEVHRHIDTLKPAGVRQNSSKWERDCVGDQSQHHADARLCPPRHGSSTANRCGRLSAQPYLRPPAALPIGSIQVYTFPSHKNFTLMGFFSVLKNFVSHPKPAAHPNTVPGRDAALQRHGKWRCHRRVRRRNKWIRTSFRARSARSARALTA